MKTFAEYETAMLRTFLGDDRRLEWNALGLAGEAGECADYIKKVVFHNHPLDREKLTKELGDVLWYLAALAHCNGTTLAEVAAANVAKLETRYPNGFETKASVARVDVKDGET